MKKPVLVAALTLLTIPAALAQTTPLTLTGFTDDVIANGSGVASSSTSTGIDGVTSLLSTDFRNGSGQSGSIGLPANRILTSGLTTFKLAGYSGNNALHLVGTSTGTLTVTTPQKANHLYVLATAANGVSTFQMTVNFTDGSQKTFSEYVSDWFVGSSPFIGGLGVVDRNTDAISTGAQLYQLTFDMNWLYQDKFISSVDFSSLGGGLLNVLALSIEPNLSPFTPLTLTGFTDDVIANGSGPAINSTTSGIDGSSALISNDFTNGSGQPGSGGLTIIRVVSSGLTTDLTFDLADYSANNALHISGTGTGTLTVAAPQSAKRLYVLATSGNGSSTTDITVTFHDGSQQVFPNRTVSDWIVGTSPTLSGLGIVSRITDDISSGARLFQIPLPISAANQSKRVNSVQFSNTGADLNVLAITAENTATGLPDDEATQLASAWPTPMTDVLHVEVANPAIAQVQLLDLLGRPALTAAVHDRRATFQVSTLPAGIYLVRSAQGRARRVVKE